MVKIYQGLGVVLLGSLAAWDWVGLARVACPVEIVRASGLAVLSLEIPEEAAVNATAGFDSARDRR
jgi:hypothetical protein